MSITHGVIFDSDGTVYLDDQLIPGARETIEGLRRDSHAIVFVSNKPLESRSHYAAKLTWLEVPSHPDHVFDSSLVLIHYLSRHMPGPRCLPSVSSSCWESWRLPAFGPAKIRIRLTW